MGTSPMIANAHSAMCGNGMHGSWARLDGREVVEEEDARQLVASGHIALLEVLRHRVLVGEDGAVADVLVDRGHDLCPRKVIC